MGCSDKERPTSMLLRCNSFSCSSLSPTTLLPTVTGNTGSTIAWTIVLLSSGAARGAGSCCHVAASRGDILRSSETAATFSVLTVRTGSCCGGGAAAQGGCGSPWRATSADAADTQSSPGACLAVLIKYSVKYRHDKEIIYK